MNSKHNRLAARQRDRGINSAHLELSPLYSHHSRKNLQRKLGSLIHEEKLQVFDDFDMDGEGLILYRK